MSRSSNQPVIVGAGQVTDRASEGADVANLSSPVELMEESARRAFADAGLNLSEAHLVDHLTVVDTMYPTTRNLPESLARRLGAERARRQLAPVGGNAPQFLVNRYFERIANGELQMVLLSGGEALANARRIIKADKKPAWEEPSESDPELAYPVIPMATPYEKAHGVWPARHVYALFENALRGHYGHGIAEHQNVLGELMAEFSKVAQESAYAWFQQERSARDIAESGPGNRYVGWPYTKFMNAMNQVNQSASLLLTNEEVASRLGVPQEKWVYLHGCADVNDIWYVSERVSYYQSPAIRRLGERALRMAGRTIDEIDHLDLYSCFPSAIQIARDELGIAADDVRPLTVTGGLPFHGGAGSSYVMSAIAAMVEKLRSNAAALGLVTANGGLLSEHSAGIYSTSPGRFEGRWQREDPSLAQQEIEELERPAVIEKPHGVGFVETYTVAVGRSGEPERGIVVGRLGEGPLSPRFLANTPIDQELLYQMMEEDFLGVRGEVKAGTKQNIFSPSQ